MTDRSQNIPLEKVITQINLVTQNCVWVNSHIILHSQAKGSHDFHGTLSNYKDVTVFS